MIHSASATLQRRGPRMNYGAPCCLETTKAPAHAAAHPRAIRGRGEAIARFAVHAATRPRARQSMLWNGFLAISRPEHALEWISRDIEARRIEAHPFDQRHRSLDGLSRDNHGARPRRGPPALNPRLAF